jgi:hypothetical protein
MNTLIFQVALTPPRNIEPRWTMMALVAAKNSNFNIQGSVRAQPCRRMIMSAKPRLNRNQATHTLSILERASLSELSSLVYNVLSASIHQSEPLMLMHCFR